MCVNGTQRASLGSPRIARTGLTLWQMESASDTASGGNTENAHSVRKRA